MQTCRGSFRLHLAFICMESMAGMCATIHFIIEADELFVQALQATYPHMDFGTVFGHHRCTCLYLFTFLFILHPLGQV